MNVKFSFFLLAIGLLTMFSCKSDSDVNCDNEAEIERVLENGLDDVLTATFDYAGDQSTSNCNKLKDVYSSFIDTLEDFQSCADEVGEGDEFREAIQDSREALNDLPC